MVTTHETTVRARDIAVRGGARETEHLVGFGKAGRDACAAPPRGAAQHSQYTFHMHRLVRRPTERRTYTRKYCTSGRAQAAAVPRGSQLALNEHAGKTRARAADVRKSSARDIERKLGVPT